METNQTFLEGLQQSVRQSSQPRDIYEKQIRADAAYFVIPVVVFFTFVAALSLWFVASPTLWRPAPIFISVGSVIVGRYCWYLLRRQEELVIERVGFIFCISHILFITLVFVSLWPEFVVIPYLYLIFVMIAGHIIYPQAGFYMWYLSCVAMIVSILVRGGSLTQHIIPLLAPIVLGGVFSVVTYFVMQDWVTAVLSASRSHLLASKQRDELYVLKGELEQARDRQNGLYTELNTIAGVGRQMVSLLDLDVLLQFMAKAIHEEMGYAYVSIFLIKQNSEQLLLLADAESEHLKSRYPTIYPVSINANHIIAQAAKRKTVLSVNQINQGDYPPHPYQRSYAFAEIVFPLVVRSELMGVLNIQSTSSTSFDGDSLKNLQTLADQAAIAIYNATLYQEILLRHQLMTTLNDINRAISSTLNIDHVLDLILSNLEDLVSCNRTAILLLEKDQLQIVAHRGFPETSGPERVRIRLKRHGDAFTTIRTTMEPVRFDDAAAHETWQGVEGLTQTRSWLGAPLIENDKVIGMLSLARVRVSPFTDAEMELTVAFASQVSVALGNAQAFDKMTQARAEAERANRLKGRFISNMSHEFKTPLNGIINMTGFVLDGVLGDVNEKQQGALQHTVDSGHHLLSMVNDILDVTKFEAGMMKIPFVDVDILVLLQEIAVLAVGLVKGRAVEVRTDYPDTLPLVEGNRRRIRQILLNLVSNAVKYTAEGSISITAQLIESGEEMHIAVADTGIGIPDEDKEFVFESFGQAQNNIDNPLSTGLGLPIAKQLVGLHHGRIWFESVMDKGSTFYVCLPIRQPEENK